MTQHTIQYNDKNQKHDFWISYYSDGSIWYKGQYVNGFKHGHWIDNWLNKNKITFYLK